MMRSLLFTLLSLAFLPALHAQPPKAKKAFDEGVTHYLRHEYYDALKQAEKAVRLYPGYTEAWILKADVHREMQDTALAVDAYVEAIHLEPDFFAGCHYSAAWLLFLSMEYAEALRYFESYLAFPRLDKEQRDRAEFYRTKCLFAIEAMGAPVPFKPSLLPAGVNSEYDEFVNTVSLDGSELYFTRLYPSDVLTPAGRFVQEDFFMSRLENEAWSMAEPVPAPLNSAYDDGNLNFSPDGRYAFFATQRPEGYGRYDIYASVRNGENWGRVFNLGPVINSTTWDSQPCFSSDGKTIYFVSLRQGGQGSSDIWTSELQEDGTWSEPHNLGPLINTPHREMTPVIHPDNQTLYFASEGHPGMGGLDMFVSRRQPDGSWGLPENLGWPLNQVRDEQGFVIHPNGEQAYFSRENPGKGMDIYEVALPPVARAIPVTYLAGRITDKESSKPMQAIFRLVDLESGDTLVQALSDSRTGQFMVPLPTNRSYALFAEQDAYYFHSEHFVIRGDHPQDDPYRLDIALEPIRSGKSIVLRNVFFDVDRYDLKPESFIELNKFVRLMDENPELRAEVGGHTDNTGSADHNRELSLNRAQAVYDYLVDKGISAERLSYKGYGMDVPIATNDTPEGRQLNRRTEIRFLEP